MYHVRRHPASRPAHRYRAARLVSAAILVVVATLIVHLSTAQVKPTSGTPTTEHRASQDADPTVAPIGGQERAPCD